jgi:hypothetical protein
MIAEFMSEAEIAPGSTRLLLNAGDSDGAANRAYYAMFCGIAGCTQERIQHGGRSRVTKVTEIGFRRFARSTFT